MTDPDDHNALPRAAALRVRNRRTAQLVGLGVIAMIGLSFASVPLYNLFCRVTGFGGTTMLARAAPDHELARTMTVRFNSDTAPDLPWHFRPEQRAVSMPIGRKTLINFKAENYSRHPVTGTAVYNVTPPKAGKYFHKMECFCFGEQLLTPGEKMDMPVVFFIDPAIAADRDMDDVTTITLSYSFFKAGSGGLEQALEDFYNQPAAAAGLAGSGS